MTRLVIGLVGRKGSGKGTVAKILKETYGASVYRFSDTLRDILDILFLEQSREHLVHLSEVLRNGFGQGVLKQAIIKRVEHDAADLVVLDGVRRIDDLEELDVLGDLKLISVEAPLEMRFERLRARGENVGEATRTLESFKELEHASTEVTIVDVEARANVHIDNSSDREHLEKQIEILMAKQNPSP